MNIAKHTPLFFRKLPVTEHTPANAVYSKFLQALPKTEAHEIVYCNERWTVGRNDFYTAEEGMAVIAKTYQRKIEEARVLHNPKTLKALAACLGCSEATLRNRMRLIRNHLPPF